MNRALCGLLLVFASVPGLRSQAAAPVSTVLHDVRLIDGDGGVPREHVDVVLRGGLVADGVDVLAHGVRDVPVDQEFIDALKSHHVGYIPTLALLVRAGLTPVQAIGTATKNAAAPLGLDDRGVVQPGKLADLIVVDGNPDHDIADVDSISAVWHRGRPVAGDLNSFTP